MNTCPCCSQKKFSDCCEPYIIGLKHASTPEILMRSRYAAYSLANIDYIQKTMCKTAAENFDSSSARKWASSTQWLGLTVIEAPKPSDQFGTVTFFARFSEHHVKKYIYEKSDFEKINDTWFYIGGMTPSINRNDHCPCGSGKKSKKCCFLEKC